VEMTNKQQDNDSNKNMDGIFEFDAFFWSNTVYSTLP
jgi:hypothetical protein